MASWLAGLRDATDSEAALKAGAETKIGVMGESGTPVGIDAVAGMNTEAENPLRLMDTNPPSGWDATT